MDETINSYNDIAKKGEKKCKIKTNTEQTKIFGDYSFFQKKFDEELDTTDTPDLES